MFNLAFNNILVISCIYVNHYCVGRNRHTSSIFDHDRNRNIKMKCYRLNVTWLVPLMELTFPGHLNLTPVLAMFVLLNSV